MSDVDPPQRPESARIASDLARSRAARALKHAAPFALIDRAAREALIDAASIEVVAASAAIFEQGAAAETLVILGRGRARVERLTGDGGVFPLAYRGSGDVLGESCLGGRDARTERVVAMEESELVHVPLALVRGLSASDTAFGGAVLGLLVKWQRETEDRIASMLFHNVEGRLCEYLLKAAERWGVPTPGGVLISAPVTHAEIAQVIGSTRETVTLTLGALRKEGALDVTGRRLIVRDKEALARRR